jgi:hypothetical protein
LLVNLVNRAVTPTLTPRLHIVEEVPPTGRITVELRLEKKPRAVTLEPGAQPVKRSYRDGRLTAQVEEVRMHSILAVEL